MDVREAKKCNACGSTYDSSLSYCLLDGTPLVLLDPLIGTTLDGRYRIDGLLGRGGMGAVYRATHIHIDAVFAVKVLHPGLVANQDAIERFRREAKAAGRLDHPNAIRVTDFGVTNEKIVYLVMELVNGQSLRELLEKERLLDYHRAANIMHQACAAIEVAHQQGIVHRDLKPDNIMVERVGETERVKVLDFGIAKLRESAASPNAPRTLTKEGTVIGTPEYMSPEQCEGATLDSRSDIYSLGVILYEMLSGRPPFTAGTPIQVIIKHLSGVTRPLREICPTAPEPIERVVMRAIKKDPAARPASATQFSEELRAAVEAATSSDTRELRPSRQATDPSLMDGQARRSGVETMIDTLPESLPPTHPPRSAEKTALPAPAAAKARDVSGEHRPRQKPGHAGANLGVGVQEADEYATIASSQLLRQAAGKSAKPRMLLIAVAAAACITIIGIGVYQWRAPSVSSNPTSSPSPMLSAEKDMVYIPGGTFIMGRQDGEADERPAHEVEIKPFYLDKFEVTNQQYQRFVDATGRPAPKNWENGTSAPDEATLPVTNVTWQDAADYAKWANKRLPKEEEWEYVARGGKGYLYPWGNEWQDGFANVNRRESQKPAPVQSFEKDQSLFGVYDLAGNVSEWVQDFYSESYGGPLNKKLKVYRGGNFYDKPKTSTFRWSDYPTPPAETEERLKYNSGTLSKVGFRCAKDAGQ